VGKFLQRIRHKLVGTADGLVAYLQSVDDILPQVNTTIDYIGDIKPSLQM